MDNLIVGIALFPKILLVIDNRMIHNIISNERIGNLLYRGIQLQLFALIPF